MNKKEFKKLILKDIYHPVWNAVFKYYPTTIVIEKESFILINSNENLFIFEGNSDNQIIVYPKTSLNSKIIYLLRGPFFYNICIDLTTSKSFTFKTLRQLCQCGLSTYLTYPFEKHSQKCIKIQQCCDWNQEDEIFINKLIKSFVIKID